MVMEPVACALATSPNGRWLAMGGRDGRVRLLDLERPTLEVMKSTGRHAEVVKSLSFSPDSTQLASGAQDGTMLVWSSKTLDKLAGPFKGHSDAVWWICYSLDGSKIASCDREVIQIWDRTTGASVAINEEAWSLAWSDDGRLFAGCINGSIKIYNPNTGALRATCSGHSDVVFSIALSHNTNFFATASWDKTIRLWETVTFQQIGPNLRHDAQVHSVSISPDDNHLVSGARDSNIRVWNLRNLAPNLFKDFPLEPNRGPTNSTPLLVFPNWRVHTRDRDPSNALDHDGLLSPDPHNESPESSDHSSTKSKSSKKGRIWGLFRPKTPQIDLIDDPRTPSPSVQGSPYTHSSNSSLHCPVDDLPTSLSPCGRSPISMLHDPIIMRPPSSNPPSPTQSRKPVSETENASFIREIRSDPTNNLTGSIVPEGTHPVSGGSHGDIYRGMLNVNGRTMAVAIKVIKKYSAQGNDLSKQRRLRREIKLWLKLEHRNVIPLLGTTKDYGDFPAMVCPWVENGSLTFYIDRRNNNLTPQQRFGIINDVALGLQYLHSQSVVHGDISGSNILIYGSGRACIADFGLSIVVTEIEGSSIALTYQVKGTLRWTAPELFEMREPENEDEDALKIFPTLESDMYSFAGIMLHVRVYRNLPF
ncbi:WD40-repeat-containing domain protein [Butyriboletus roseoflavus]|nr:WD40-repeat-containing domain protein [Butyriboletus roseoflavus]